MRVYGLRIGVRVEGLGMYVPIQDFLDSIAMMLSNFHAKLLREIHLNPSRPRL